MVSRPTSATIPRRWLSSVSSGPSTGHSRLGADHTPSPQSPPAGGCPAASVASVVNSRSARPVHPARHTLNRRGGLPVGTSPPRPHIWQTSTARAAAPASGSASTCVPTPRVPRASGRRGTGDPWHPSGGRESEAVWMSISSIVLITTADPARRREPPLRAKGILTPTVPSVAECPSTGRSAPAGRP